MTIDTTCHECGASMKLVRKERVADTAYHYLHCEHCKREVARRED